MKHFRDTRERLKSFGLVRSCSDLIISQPHDLLSDYCILTASLAIIILIFSSAPQSTTFRTSFMQSLCCSVSITLAYCLLCFTDQICVSCFMFQRLQVNEIGCKMWLQNTQSKQTQILLINLLIKGIPLKYKAFYSSFTVQIILF